MKKISVVTPCYNEEDSIIKCYETIKLIFEKELPQYQREHIFCDNASNDKTLQILKLIASEDPYIKIIVNSKNFGPLKNTYNGVLNASGDCIFTFVPADLQDPPELIPQFISLWNAGYEIVYGIRQIREENYWVALLRKIYYRLLSKLTYADYPPDVGDFQLIDKCILNELKRIDDAQPFMRIMTLDCGFKAVGVPYTWKSRKIGKSNNSLLNMIDQGLNGLISFTTSPIRIALITGFSISFISIVYAISIFLLTLFGHINSPVGIPTIVIAIFFFGGIQLFFMGILGEYILAIFKQVRKRPLVIERERINF